MGMFDPDDDYKYPEGWFDLPRLFPEIDMDVLIDFCRKELKEVGLILMLNDDCFTANKALGGLAITNDKCRGRYWTINDSKPPYFPPP